MIDSFILRWLRVKTYIKKSGFLLALKIIKVTKLICFSLTKIEELRDKLEKKSNENRVSEKIVIRKLWKIKKFNFLVDKKRAKNYE